MEVEEKAKSLLLTMTMLEAAAIDMIDTIASERAALSAVLTPPPSKVGPGSIPIVGEVR